MTYVCTRRKQTQYQSAAWYKLSYMREQHLTPTRSPGDFNQWVRLHWYCVFNTSILWHMMCVLNRYMLLPCFNPPPKCCPPSQRTIVWVLCETWNSTWTICIYFGLLTDVDADPWVRRGPLSAQMGLDIMPRFWSVLDNPMSTWDSSSPIVSFYCFCFYLLLMENTVLEKGRMIRVKEDFIKENEKKSATLRKVREAARRKKPGQHHHV